MAKEINPFIVTGKIAPEYFCDRVQESARLIKSLVNGNNMVSSFHLDVWVRLD